MNLISNILIVNKKYLFFWTNKSLYILYKKKYENAEII